jgi:hypothetical protein
LRAVPSLCCLYGGGKAPKGLGSTVVSQEDHACLRKGDVMRRPYIVPGSYLECCVACSFAASPA